VREPKILMECDVLVAGGGPAGVAAGVAAARLGAETVILERNGFFGGNLTATGIDTMYAFYTVGEDQEKVIGGIPDDVVARLEAMDACYERPNTYGSGTGVTFSTPHMKVAMEEVVQRAGAHYLFHAFVPEVVTEGGRPAGLVFGTKEGLKSIRAAYIVDATGDGDVIASAGGSFEKAGENGPIQSCTTVFFMANVDVDRAKAFGKQAMWEAMREAHASGAYDLPRTEGSWHPTPFPGMIETNMTRMANVDTTDIEEISAAETEGRRQVMEYQRFLRERVPGFENAYLAKTGSTLGVREARRAIGDYVLTVDDVLEGHRFEDAIARCGMPVEDHHAGTDTRWVYVKDHSYYEIPYRCLLPQGLDNVLVAGRCLSATHDAHASARSSATAMGMGQAAGIAAAQALDANSSTQDVDVSTVQDILREWGAPI